MEFDSFVLAASTASLGDEPRAREHADAVEFRMDLAADPLAALDDYDGALPVVATNRAEWEGGEATDDEARLDALQAAAEHEAVAAVDVELQSITKGDGDRVVEHARDHDATAIVSVHDFDGTPSLDGMRGLLASATDHGDVGKLAVQATAPVDVLDLLRATAEFADNGARVATMAMGEAGRHSRAVAPLYGSVVGYAPLDPDEATAPGQYDLATLRHLVDALS
ncbi:type I 3-dehydroquinate dehydratase [Halobacteriaceae archaeon GCM10025711]